MKLVKNVALYAPSYQGRKSVLFHDKIIKIADHINIEGLDVEVIDGSQFKMIPGLIDNHVHITGGGGEAGYQSKVPPMQLSDFILGGVTTAVGLLGTDGFTRSMKALIVKAKALKSEGLSVYVLSGSYQVPLKTTLDTLEDDMCLIEEIIGAGEVAISDHRSSAPSVQALKQILSSVHVGGLLSGKGGVLNVHVGSATSGLNPLIQLIEETDFPRSKIIPTHINRNQSLLSQGIAYAKQYKAPIDLTAYFNKDDDLSAHKALKIALEKGVDHHLITISSDGGGSLPVFDENQTLKGMGVGSVQALLHTLKQGVLESHIPFETILKTMTQNVASLYHLPLKGHLKKTYDADLLLIDDAFTLQHVFMKGTHVLNAGTITKKGMFE